MSSFALIARFETPAALVAAAGAARAKGYRKIEAYAPFPVPGLTEALGFRERRIAPLALAGALAAAVFFYWLQWYSGVIDYPFVVGGKPPNSWPAFLPVTFAMAILAAVAMAIVVMLIGNRLPKPYHPAFNCPAFDRASDDGYFLLIEDSETDRVRSFLRDQQAAEIEELKP